MRNNSLLRNTLLANATFSLLCGIDALAFNRYFMRLFGVENSYVFPILGVGLLGFCLTVFWEARKHTVKRGSVKFIIGQDIAWVLGSIIIILTNIFTISTAGRWIVGGVALVVAAFAMLQYRGLKKTYET